MDPDDEILAREAELRRAQLESDVDALDRLLDDCLLFTSFDGTIATKNDDYLCTARDDCESRAWSRLNGGCCIWATRL